MRVCHIWHNFFPVEAGGVEHYIRNLSNCLVRQDPAMKFCMFTDKANVRYNVRKRLLKSEKIDNIQVYRLGPNFTTYLRNACYKVTNQTYQSLTNLATKSLFNEAERIQKQESSQIFHVHGIWKVLYPNIGVQLSKRFRAPLMVSLHGDSANSEDQFSMPLSNPQVLAVLNHAKVITTFSKQNQHVLDKLGLGEKTFLVPNFIDVKSFINPDPKKTRFGYRAVMVSRLDEAKNPESVVRAFAKAKKKVPEATLQIVGYGPLYDSITKLVTALGLEHSVTVTDRAQDVRKFLWENDVFIATKSSYVACLEAWAAGLAVVAPRCGIFKEIMSEGNNGLLFKGGQVDQLAEALITMFENKVLQEKLVANSQKAVAQNDTQIVCKQIQALYNSVI